MFESSFCPIFKKMNFGSLLILYPIPPSFFLFLLFFSSLLFTSFLYSFSLSSPLLSTPVLYLDTRKSQLTFRLNWELSSCSLRGPAMSVCLFGLDRFVCISAPICEDTHLCICVFCPLRLTRDQTQLMTALTLSQTPQPTTGELAGAQGVALINLWKNVMFNVMQLCCALLVWRNHLLSSRGFCQMGRWAFASVVVVRQLQAAASLLVSHLFPSPVLANGWLLCLLSGVPSVNLIFTLLYNKNWGSKVS